MPELDAMFFASPLPFGKKKHARTQKKAVCAFGEGLGHESSGQNLELLLRTGAGSRRAGRRGASNRHPRGFPRGALRIFVVGGRGEKGVILYIHVKFFPFLKLGYV